MCESSHLNLPIHIFFSNRRNKSFRFLIISLPFVIVASAIMGGYNVYLWSTVSSTTSRIDWGQLLAKYKIDTASTVFVDWTQSQFECCGILEKVITMSKSIPNVYSPYVSCSRCPITDDYF